MPAVLELDFDPLFTVAGFGLRWEAIALALAICFALVAFTVSLRHSLGPVRRDDVAFVVLAVVPGAVVGGRLVHGLDYLGAYAAQPQALFDLSRGSISLVGAVLGGALSATYVCRLLGCPVGRWAATAALPLLLAIGLGKLASVLGGAGQGVPMAGTWALAFGGSGPWISVDPATPATPSQVYEGLWVLAGVPILALVSRVRPARWSADARWLLLALAWWLAGRFVTGFTWRDEPGIGSLGAEQLATLAGLAGVLVTLAVIAGRRRSATRRPPEPRASDDIDDPAHLENAESPAAG